LSRKEGIANAFRRPYPYCEVSRIPPTESLCITVWAYAEFRSYPSDKPCPEFEVNYISTLVNTTHVHKKRDIRAVLGPNNMAFKSLSLWEN